MAKKVFQAEGKGAIGYVRVSTAEQSDHGVSLAAQEDRIRAYCTLRGLELVALVADPGVSAGKPLGDRDGGACVLEALKAGRVAHVVALKLDRLFRDTIDCLTTVKAWDRAGVSLHLVDMGGASLDTSSAMGRLFLTMTAGFAELERNMIKERTQAAMSHKKARGERVGTVEYGFRLSLDGLHLEPCPAEQETIEKMKTLRADGLSFRKIGAGLEALALKARNGRKFHPQTIAQVLERVA